MPKDDIDIPTGRPIRDPTRGNLATWLAIHCAEYLIREPPEIGYPASSR